MTSTEPPPSTPPPLRPPFQFTLRTLLLLFVVLGSSLAVFGAWGIGVFGPGVGGDYIRHARSLVAAASLVWSNVFSVSLGCCCRRSKSARESLLVRRAKTICGKSRGLASYHQAHGCFPPAYVADKSGKPMHSWRVLILPYLDYEDVYTAYDFGQPWDGPKNKHGIGLTPPGYICPSASRTLRARSQTSYLAVVGPEAAWAGENRGIAGRFPGGPSDTVMVVEVTNSGIAGRAEGPSLDSLVGGKTIRPELVERADMPKQGFLFTYHRQGRGVNVAMADGSVRYLTAGRASEDFGTCSKSVVAGRRRSAGMKDFSSLQRHLNWPNIAALAVWLLSVGTLLTCAVRSRKPTGRPMRRGVVWRSIRW